MSPPSDSAGSAPNPGAGPEARTAPRAPIELRVDYAKVNTFFADYTKNLSRGGTFIKTPHPLPIGTTFVFKLGVPGFAAAFELRGEVTWVLAPEDAGRAQSEAGMGIRFVFDDPARKQEFEAAVEKLMVDSLGEEIFRQLVDHPTA